MTNRVVMQVLSAWPPALRAVPGAPLRAGRIGYLVPRETCHTAVVHSCFRRACNVALGAQLLTLAADEAGAGPTRVELGRDAPSDLRALWRAGETVHWSRDGLSSARAVVRWPQASVWRPSPPRPRAAPRTIAARLAQVQHVLRERAVGWCDGTDGLPDRLVAACRAARWATAEAIVGRMIGRGDGLTPACDDFVLGVLAAFDDAAGARSSSHDALRSTLADAVLRHLPRTTPISAHQLRLGVAGHHGERLLALRDVLVAAKTDTSLAVALDAVLAVGASSGAAMAAGLAAGVGLALPASVGCEQFAVDAEAAPAADRWANRAALA